MMTVLAVLNTVFLFICGFMLLAIGGFCSKFFREFKEFLNTVCDLCDKQNTTNKLLSERAQEYKKERDVLREENIKLVDSQIRYMNSIADVLDKVNITYDGGAIVPKSVVADAAEKAINPEGKSLDEMVDEIADKAATYVEEKQRKQEQANETLQRADKYLRSELGLPSVDEMATLAAAQSQFTCFRCEKTFSGFPTPTGECKGCYDANTKLRPNKTETVGGAEDYAKEDYAKKEVADTGESGMPPRKETGRSLADTETPESRHW